jgi:hypothetical protein
MQINPDSPSHSMIQIDGQMATISQSHIDNDGKLVYTLSDGSILSTYAKYDGKNIISTMSKSSTEYQVTCNSEQFSGNGW